MSFGAATLILTGQDGTPRAMALVPTDDFKIELPEHEAGPFLFEFVVEDEEGPKKFESKILINDQRITAIFENFPIILETAKALYPDKVLEEILDTSRGNPISVHTLNPSKLFKHGKYVMIRIDKESITSFIVDDQGKGYTFDFYNFYANGEVCMGTLSFNKNEKPIQRLAKFITSRTTPHTTMTDRKLKFRPKDGMVIKDQGGTVANKEVDIPEYKEIIKKLANEKPLARITPA